MNVASIASARLHLVSFSPELISALEAGDRDRAEADLGARIPASFPDQSTLRWLGRRREQMKRQPRVQEWLARGMVLLGPAPELIGHIGFHGGPSDSGMVEVGYTVFPPYRRRGYALEACSGLFDWAASTHGIHHFRASVSPANQASLGVVTKLGFKRTGSQWDKEDGEELVFELVGY